MKKIAFLPAVLAAAVLLVLVRSTSAPAQDPLVVNTQSVHLKLENDHVRVLEALLQPGQKEQMHSHPACVIYVIAGGKTRNHGADGRTTEAVLHSGDVFYRDPVIHWAENIGTTPIHLVLVELKPAS